MDALANANPFQTTHSIATADWLALGDFNHDSQVNSTDLGLATQAVPEPATLVMGLTAALGIVFVRRRRAA
jgi:hypothetical protein